MQTYKKRYKFLVIMKFKPQEEKKEQGNIYMPFYLA